MVFRRISLYIRKYELMATISAEKKVYFQQYFVPIGQKI